MYYNCDFSYGMTKFFNWFNIWETLNNTKYSDENIMFVFVSNSLGYNLLLSEDNDNYKVFITYRDTTDKEFINNYWNEQRKDCLYEEISDFERDEYYRLNIVKTVLRYMDGCSEYYFATVLKDGIPMSY